MNFIADKKDSNVDVCIYEDGNKCCTIKAIEPTETEDWQYEFIVKINEEDSEKLWKGDYEYSARIDWEEFEEGDLNIYTHAKDRKKD